MKTIDALLGRLQVDAPLRQVIVGACLTAVVLETEPPRCGLATSLIESSPHPHDRPLVRHAGRLLESGARRLAEGLRSPSGLEAAVGMAAYNALLDVDETNCVELNGEALIKERGSGGRVAIVGHFPFVDRIRRMARQCWVLELNPGPGDVPAERAAEILPQADVVALTGTTLLNHTFDGLMELPRRDAFVILLGASAPLTPVLLERGVHAVAGTRVEDVGAAVRAVAEGATFRQIPGKRLLTLMNRTSSIDETLPDRGHLREDHPDSHGPPLKGGASPERA